MNRCIQTDHFLSVVLSQGASLRGLMGLTPKKKNNQKIKRDVTGLFCGIQVINNRSHDPVGGDIYARNKHSLFFSHTQHRESFHLQRLVGSLNLRRHPGLLSERWWLICGRLPVIYNLWSPPEDQDQDTETYQTQSIPTNLPQSD